MFVISNQKNGNHIKYYNCERSTTINVQRVSKCRVSNSRVSKCRCIEMSVSKCRVSNCRVSKCRYSDTDTVFTEITMEKSFSQSNR